MSLVRQGNMICFDEGDDRFQLRAVGIAVRDGYLLVHRATYEDFWSLPGGRVERDESAAETLEREMLEELQQPVRVGSLLFVIENFFTLGSRRYHELGLYHRIDVPDVFPFGADGQVVHRVRDGASDLEFKWVLLEHSAIDALRLKPSSLVSALLGEERGRMHFVDRENAPLPVIGVVP